MVSANTQLRRRAATCTLPEPLLFAYAFGKFRYQYESGPTDILPPAIRVDRPVAWQIAPNCAWVISERGRVITGLRPLSELLFFGDILFPTTGKKSLLLARFERSPDWTPNRIDIAIFPEFYTKKRTQISGFFKKVFGNG